MYLYLYLYDDDDDDDEGDDDGVCFVFLLTNHELYDCYITQDSRFLETRSPMPIHQRSKSTHGCNIKVRFHNRYTRTICAIVPTRKMTSEPRTQTPTRLTVNSQHLRFTRILE